MQASSAGSALRRRWAVALVGLMITGGAVVMAMLRLPSEYLSTAQVLLLPPSTEMETPGNSKSPLMTNPYMELDYALSAATDVIISSVTTADSMASIEQGQARVSVARATPQSGGSVPPVIVIESTAASPAAAESAATLAVRSVLAEVDRMQASTSASRSLWISSRIIEAPTPPQGVLGSRLRAAGAVLVVGLALTFLAVLAADRGGRARSGDTGIPDVEQVPARQHV